MIETASPPVVRPTFIPPDEESLAGAHLEELHRQLRELQISDARHSALFLQEQKRARHLSLVNEVQKCALASRDTEVFLSQVTRAIGSHFADCDVSLYLSSRALSGLFGDEDSAVRFWDGGADDLILLAGAGEHGLAPLPLSRRRAEELRNGEAHPEARSVLSVAVPADGDGSGWLVIQTRDAGALEARDEAALHTSAAIIGAYLQSSRMTRSMNEINDFNQSLLTSMMHSLLVVDKNGIIQFVNQRLLDTFGAAREDFHKHPLERVFGESPARHHDLRAAIEGVLESGEGREVPEVHVWSRDGNQIFDVRLFRVYFRGQAETALLMINLTQRWRKTYQLQLMHEIGRLFQEAVSLDVNRVLSTVLTCITAGSALGFTARSCFCSTARAAPSTGAWRLAPGPPTKRAASGAIFPSANCRSKRCSRRAALPTTKKRPCSNKRARSLDTPTTRVSRCFRSSSKTNARAASRTTNCFAVPMARTDAGKKRPRASPSCCARAKWRSRRS